MGPLIVNLGFRGALLRINVQTGEEVVIKLVSGKTKHP